MHVSGGWGSRKRERERESERERDSQDGSMLSTGPDAGLDAKNCEIMT